MINFFFFIFFILLLCAFLVITVKNPVHSVLFLVCVFLESALLLFLLELEFLPIIFIVIYIGAIAILFLFVVMMIDIKLVNLPSSYLNYFSIGSFLGIIFLIEVIYSVFQIDFTFSLVNYYSNFLVELDKLNNLKTLGQFLYLDYSIHFLSSGFLLLIGMIGPIVLTLHLNSSSKNQFIYKQLSRKKSVFFVVS